MKLHHNSDKVLFERGPWQLHEINQEYSSGKIEPKIYLKWPNSVMIFAIQNEDLILIKEFCRAMNRYEIFAPKGKINPHEEPQEAALRELQEEAQVKGKDIAFIKSLSVYPNHLQGQTHIFLARDLSPSVLTCDENEEIEIIRVPLKDMTKLITSGKITEARTIAGWFLVQNYLVNESH